MLNLYFVFERLYVGTGSSIDESNLSEAENPGAYTALSQAAGRLRGIIALVNSGYLTMEILLNNLEYSARTLEALFAVESGFEEHQVRQIRRRSVQHFSRINRS